MSIYKNNIIKIIDNQMRKGKENYGHTLEEKPLQIIDAISNAQEELVDALFYLENLKERLNCNDVVYCDTDSIKVKNILIGSNHIKLWEYYDQYPFSNKVVNNEKN